MKVAQLARMAARRGHVAMVHIGRSGSTVVADLLGRHPLIKWDGEVYQPIFQEREYEDHSLPPIVDVDPVRYLIDRSRTVGGRYYGFEVKFFHLRVLGSELGPYLDALESGLPNLRFVVLKRKNTLRMVVSTLAARATGTWHRSGRSAAPRNRVRVDVDAVFVNRAASSLLELLEEFARDFAELDRLLQDRPSLHLTYEDDVAQDPKRAYRRICELLELPALWPRVRLSRTNPYAPRDLIENFDEVAAALSGTDFEWMLDDP